jgi:sec-independent protein translocase protein TatC
MPDDPGADPLDDQAEEEGGPVKSFLEHLEDLRWVLIKSCSAAGVAMIGCLLAGNYVVQVLEWPLRRAPINQPKFTQSARVLIGTNQIGVIQVTTNDPLSAITGTNRFVQLQITPVLINDRQVLTITAQKDDEVLRHQKLPIEIINLSPAGSFIVATKVAFYGGIVISAPFIFYFVAAFVFPALKMRERKYIYRGLGFGAGLFMTGVCFCYFVLMPVALAASAKYAEWMGFTANQWRAEEYIGFVCKFLLGMGLGFELPVVVLTLVKIGVLNYRMLSHARRYVIVINFVLGAVLTTPEVITQVLMALPLQLLFEVSVWITWYWERQEKKREAAEAAADAVGQT